MTTAMAVSTFACERLDIGVGMDGERHPPGPPELSLLLRGPAEVDRLLAVAGVGRAVVDRDLQLDARSAPKRQKTS